MRAASGEASDRPAALPALVAPEHVGETLLHAAPRLRALGEPLLRSAGAVLFRGFASAGRDDFSSFAASHGHALINYEFGSTPRTNKGGGVYSSTEYPAHQHIPLHNEQSYSQQWPMKIWFYAERVAQSGGETPIADSRAIYRRMPSAITRRFERDGVLYVRNFGNGLDVPWWQTFETEDRSAVEEVCRRRGIACEWKADGELRTRERGQGVARHPRTLDWVWFNQAHLFHVSALPNEAREALLACVEPEDLPRNAYYGDGTEIEASVLEEIRGVLSEQEVVFPWQAGDVLMLDNMLTAHARRPFLGLRSVSVAMAEPHR